MLNIRNCLQFIVVILLVSSCSSPIDLSYQKPFTSNSIVSSKDLHSANRFSIDLDLTGQEDAYPIGGSIYYDFDNYSVLPKFRALIESHAQYLGRHRDQAILIQGNTDERGGREYNLALGQKRAEAVQRALLLLGVSKDQVEAVSLGEEKPKSIGRDSSAFAENRRSDLIYQE